MFSILQLFLIFPGLYILKVLNEKFRVNEWKDEMRVEQKCEGIEPE